MIQPFAPKQIPTQRLILRKPREGDGALVYERYAQEKEKLLDDVNSRIERMFECIHVADETESYENSLGIQNPLAALSKERDNFIYSNLALEAENIYYTILSITPSYLLLE